MFLLLVFTGLEYEQYGSYAYRTEQLRVAGGPIRRAFGDANNRMKMSATPAQDVYEIRPRNDRTGSDLISDRLRYGPIWCAGPDAVRYAVAYAKFCSRSHQTVIRVFNEEGNVTEIHKQ